VKQSDQEKMKENIKSVFYRRSGEIPERLEKVSEYVIARMTLAHAQAGMIAILVGGFCLMLGLYIGLHIPR
jgi:hypothetical protein